MKTKILIATNLVTLAYLYYYRGRSEQYKRISEAFYRASLENFTNRLKEKQFRDELYSDDFLDFPRVVK